MTRLNVYAGPAGFFIIRGGPAGDGSVLDSRTGMPPYCPDPRQAERRVPAEEDLLRDTDRHSGPVFQCRRFVVSTRTRAPSSTASGSLHTGHRRLADLEPEFFGNVIMVNGNTWPFLNVEQRRYRFRFLNAATPAS